MSLLVNRWCGDLTWCEVALNDNFVAWTTDVASVKPPPPRRRSSFVIIVNSSEISAFIRHPAAVPPEGDDGRIEAWDDGIK